MPGHPEQSGDGLRSPRIVGGRGGRTTEANAVQFDSLGGTLVVDPGAVFLGNVVASPPAVTTLQLAGSAAGTLAGIGTQFTGFSTISVASGANWLLTGTNTVNELFTDLGTLDINGTAEIFTGGTLLVSGSGQAAISTFILQGGTVSDQGQGQIVVGPSSAGGKAGTIVINSGGTISGLGSVVGPVLDNGAVLARGGTLVLADAVSGPGVATLNAGSTMQVNRSLTVSSVRFGPGGGETLLIENGATMTAKIASFSSGDTIDVLGIKANGLSFLSGTLTLKENGAAVDQFVFKGNYTAANFSLYPDPRGGTDIGYSTGANEASDRLATGSSTYAVSEGPPLIPLSSG